MCCAADTHNYMCHTCAKEFLDSTSIKGALDKYSTYPFVSNSIEDFRLHQYRNFQFILRQSVFISLSIL